MSIAVFMASRKIVIAGIISATVFFATVVSAWTGPTASAPNSNIAAPINVGPTAQTKNGNIGVNGLAVFGNSILQASSYLNWGATAGTSGYGIRDTAGVLEFKNSGGSWASLQATIAALGGGIWTSGTGGTIYYNGGNVGVGTPSPSHKLEVIASSDWLTAKFDSPGPWTAIKMRAGNTSVNTRGLYLHYGGTGANDNNELRFGRATTDTNMGWTEANPVRFDLDAPDSTLYVNGTGSVGIGTASPATKLDVRGGQVTLQSEIHFIDENSGNGVGQQFGIYNWDGGLTIANFTSGYSWQNNRLSLDTSGSMWVTGNVNAAAFLYSSDARLKEAIQPLRDGLATLMRLNPVSYIWKNGARKGDKDIGFIAQDVEKVVPQVIHNDDDGMKSIDYIKLVPILVSSVQEQQRTINDLKLIVCGDHPAHEMCSQ